MPSSTPHQKFYFYHLHTRGWAGIKLGDAWYVSNVSIIFDCSMLYYVLFWTLLGFIIHFYIIFGTNLLTEGPAQNCCFLPVLGFRRKGISNGVQTEWNLRERDFLTEYNSGDLDPTSRHDTGGHEVGGAPYPTRRAPHPRDRFVAFLMEGPSLLDLIWWENHVSEGFIPLGFRLIFLFYQTLKQAKNNNSGLGLRLIG